MADIVSTIPFNFDELYSSLETKFQDKGYDVDEGSNTSQLITAMAYLTSMLNANTAVNINETLLPLSKQRNNILQNARNLGYEIVHKRSYKYRVTLVFEAGSYTIPKYTRFTNNDNNYYYLGGQIELTNVTEGYQLILDITEGTIKSYTDYPDELTIVTNDIMLNGDLTPQYYADVPYIDVEEDGLEVFLTYYDEFGKFYNKEVWSKTQKFMIDSETTLRKEFIRVDNIEYKTPRIYFKYAGVGEGLRQGTTIEINALISKGLLGGIDNVADLSKMEFDIPGASIINVSILSTGADEESEESIKTNAPMFHNSANRAVTELDYKAICERKTGIGFAEIWGGDKEYPKKHGRIWFSFTPETKSRHFLNTAYNTEFQLYNPSDIDNWFLPQSQIISSTVNSEGVVINPGIWNDLDEYKIPTMAFLTRHPIYVDFEYTIDVVKYSIKSIPADVNESVFNVINDYFNGDNEQEQLEKFNTEYIHSNIVRRIDTELTDITGFDNSLVTKIMLTSKNISAEYRNLANQEIIIPLAVPFENYFDGNNLLHNILPNIDTDDFLGQNFYVDWSVLTGDELGEEIITAPVMLDRQDSFTAVGGETDIETFHMPIEPTLTVNSTIQTIDVDFTFSDTTITFLSALSEGDLVEISDSSICGKYYLINSYRKYIFVKLYVNGSGSSVLETEVSDTFEYIITDDTRYFTTADKNYITTSGYETGGLDTVILDEADDVYELSPLVWNDFETARYLNLNYNSYNFGVYQNTIPRLKSVKFN